ncbi:hypothetical protein [Nonomuraea basaltis]|uniref:hypothetical protein n=1 Tax=Nonomuraea basaltis TaxID=2495887 RepID=UPI00110C56CD|nr:hypothetical protein [Nonomuraea basaltis]TMS00138.1 hypothetical protein EJK15_03440 [Nonomuraea basaltis]
MADTKTEKTVASELLTAATRLRCTTHSFPRNAISESPCERCGISAHNAWITVVNPALAEPLASWLESWDGVELREDGPLPADFEFALRIARVLNGTTS